MRRRRTGETIAFDPKRQRVCGGFLPLLRPGSCRTGFGLARNAGDDMVVFPWWASMALVDSTSNLPLIAGKFRYGAPRPAHGLCGPRVFAAVGV